MSLRVASQGLLRYEKIRSQLQLIHIRVLAASREAEAPQCKFLQAEDLVIQGLIRLEQAILQFQLCLIRVLEVSS